MSHSHGVVTSIPQTSVSPDGSYAEMTLQYSNNKQQTVRINPNIFFDLLSKTYQLVANQHIQTAAAAGHAEVTPIPVSVTMAKESVGGQVVVLSVKMQNGLPASFAVPPAEAEVLYKQLGEAIAKAKEQSSAGRH
jgi:hypothetical protein